MNYVDRLTNIKALQTYFIIFTMIVVVNIVTIASPLTLLITVPEYLLVIYTLIRGHIRLSVLFHFTFVLLSLSAQGTLGMFDGMDFSMYNYGTVKLVGPVRACYAMNIVYCFMLLGNRFKINRSLLFYKLFKVLLYLCVSASVIGVIGLLFNSGYSINSFIDYGIYAFTVLTSMYILLKIADNNTIKASYHIALVCMMSGIAGSFLCFIFGNVVTHYSVYDIAYRADITLFSTCLLIGIPFIKQKGIVWLSLILYGVLLIDSIGGKEVFGLAFALTALAYLLFVEKSSKNLIRKNDRFLRPMVIIAFLGAVVYLTHHMTTDSMAGYKMESAMSMFSGDIDSMSRSPYIRVASLINIINEGLSNPLTLLFGNGYGGYFEDKLGLFMGLDLSNGAWKDEVIATGRFTSGHDTIVTVPLFNGLVGLFLVIKICWLYIKRIPQNFMNSVAFFWILLMFYFNTICAMIGLFCLLGAEYNMKEEFVSRKTKNCIE